MLPLDSLELNISKERTPIPSRCIKSGTFVAVEGPSSNPTRIAAGARTVIPIMSENQHKYRSTYVSSCNPTFWSREVRKNRNFPGPFYEFPTNYKMESKDRSDFGLVPARSFFDLSLERDALRPPESKLP